MFLIDFPAVEDDDSSATEALLMPEKNKVSLTINFSKKSLRGFDNKLLLCSIMKKTLY
jgi:hypothetical protein